MPRVRTLRSAWLLLLAMFLLLVVVAVIQYQRDAAAVSRRPREYTEGKNFYRLEKTEYGTDYVRYLIPDPLPNGIYRFTVMGDFNLWERSLAKFKGDHPELIMTGTAVGWYQGGLSSQVNSYLVITYPATR